MPDLPYVAATIVLADQDRIDIPLGDPVDSDQLDVLRRVIAYAEAMTAEGFTVSVTGDLRIEMVWTASTASLLDQVSDPLPRFEDARERAAREAARMRTTGERGVPDA